MLWLIPWLILVKAPPKKHPWLSEEERKYILEGQQQENEESINEIEEYNPQRRIAFTQQSWGVIIASAAIRSNMVVICILDSYLPF